MSSTIRWLPTTAQLLNKPSGTLVAGRPGSGKTFFLLNTCANCLGMGQRIVGIDPKNDLPKLKNINHSIEVIDINKVHPGAMNPFTFLDDIDTPTILTIVKLLSGKLSDEDERSITPIIMDFVTKFKRDGEYVDMQDLAEYLYSRDNKNCQAIGNKLRSFSDSVYGKLLFTREENVEPLKLSSTASMVISLNGMQIPDYSTKVEDYSINERFSSAILFILTSKLYKILSVNKKMPTTLVCDEAHLLFCTKEMSKVIDKFLVLGRSLNTATILSSQGTNHFPKGIQQYISTKFIFNSSIEEAEKFIDMFDTAKYDQTRAIDRPSVVSKIARLERGQCFMIDAYDRSGFIQITSNYDKTLLSSNPLEKKE